MGKWNICLYCNRQSKRLSIKLTLTQKLFSVDPCCLAITHLPQDVSINPADLSCAFQLHTNISEENLLLWNCDWSFSSSINSPHEPNKSWYKPRRFVVCKWTVWNWTQAAVKWWGNSRQQEMQRAAEFTERGGLYNQPLNPFSVTWCLKGGDGASHLQHINTRLIFACSETSGYDSASREESCLRRERKEIV